MDAKSTLRPAEDASPADWLMPDALDDWVATTRWGPRGFPVYARVEFGGDSGDGTPDTEDPDLYARVLDVLADHTATADDCVIALWEGRGGDSPPPAPIAPIPERAMHLYRCALTDVVNSVESVWPDGFTTAMPPLTWPADHAWCVAVGVDEELAFTVACSEAAYDALVAEVAHTHTVRRAMRGDPEPLYAEDAGEPIDPRGLGEPIPPGAPGFMRYGAVGLLGGFGLGGTHDG